MEFLKDLPGYMWALVAILFGLSIFLTVMWIIVPFSIFGVKPLLKDMLQKLELIESHLDRLSANNADKPGCLSTKDKEPKSRAPV